MVVAHLVNERGVLRADPEGHDGSHIARDRGLERVGELSIELIGDGEPHFTAIGENGSKPVVREILQLVSEQIKVPVPLLWNVGSFFGRLCERDNARIAATVHKKDVYLEHALPEIGNLKNI